MIISGSVEHIIYRNSENGYTVLELFAEKRMITVSGKFPIVGVGEVLELEGEFKMHPDYGVQFVSESVRVERPTDEKAIVKYLSCGLISGVGEVTATNIVKMFGEETLKIIENEPDRLVAVRGISARKASEIHNTYKDIRKMQDAVMFLQKYDISISTAVKIFDKYKHRTEEVLTENPYKLIEDIDGIGFKTADKIAMKLGIKFDSEKRIRAGVLYVLGEIAEKQGSTLAYAENLRINTLETLELDESFLESIDKAIVDLEISGLVKRVIHEGNDAYAIHKYYSMEDYIAKKLSIIKDSFGRECYGTEQDIEQYEALEKIKLHENQKEAILAGVSEGVVVITGGPGTGKTTIIKGILKIFKNQKLKCVLMAPTGRAAKRMEEQTGEQASTIHRALEANFARNGRGFLRDENNPLDADVIIIDEISMLDVFLMNSLLKAVNYGTRLIMVGDKDQLPSVGAGNVLADIIASEKFRVVELTQIYRQSEDSMIAQNAHKINNSEMPDLKQKSSDFFYSTTSDPAAVAKEIVSLIAERIPKHFDGISSEDIQVIAPMKAGLAGTTNLNIAIQERLNPASSDKKEIELHKRIFRVGDKVMQIVNNYDREWEKFNRFGYPTYGEGVFNGDTGYIEDINEQINEIYVLFDDGRRACYSYAELDEIVLSYAITIHKSQGSEFPVVIIPIMGGSPLLMNKNLLYTAVTRAKKMVILIGKSTNIYYMVMNKSSAIRHTMLRQLLDKNEGLFKTLDIQIEE
ncbi:MAG: ATP-dependent RecD-like DNA helicase [Clostridia bacterium]|nr:ATP-dependent RecD-like DNA helicase [Clostridia bacterium]